MRYILALLWAPALDLQHFRRLRLGVLPSASLAASLAFTNRVSHILAVVFGLDPK